MLKQNDIIKRLQQHESQLNEFGVKKIGLFGSYKKNKQNSKSDIDILVKFKKGEKTFDNYMDLKFLLQDLFDKQVDLVIVENIKDELKDEILGSVEYAWF